MVMTLFKLDASPPVRAVYMTLQALKIDDVEFVDVNLLECEQLKESFLQMNPQHTVPTLKDNDFVIWDSHAIVAYLVGRYGYDYLYTTESRQRAIVDQRLHFDSGILFPALRETVEPVFFHGAKHFKQESLDKIATAYNFAEIFLTTHTWMAGEAITVADICCVATISSMNEIYPIDEQNYPYLTDWFVRLSAQEFYKNGNTAGLEQFKELIRSKLV